MALIWSTLGMPGVSGLAETSNFSESIHAGAPMICFGCTENANLIRSERFVFRVVNMPLRFTVMPQPGRWGSEGLIVATSNSGFALTSIIFGGGSGSGIVHAVVGVALTSVRGSGAPCVQVPIIVFPSALRLLIAAVDC